MVLLIDNYDSFTYNLYDYILQLGQECFVIRNDEYSLEELDQHTFSSIVLSPGPCRPKDAGILMEVIQKYYQSKPILGICLGHQALGEFFGANLVKATQPMHGKTSIIDLDNSSKLFQNASNKMEVMRYHSLVLKNLKAPLKVTATTATNEIMALEHETLPLAGVQFHPESILTKEGLKMLKRWLDWVEDF